MGNENRTENNSMEKAASAAGAARASLKTGKAVAGAAKGAAAGPYGLVAGTLWENRKGLLIVFASLSFLFLLPVLYILMLPSLIFGGNGLSSPPEKVLTDNSVIASNIAEVEKTIEEILAEKHNKVLSEIQTSVNALPAGEESEITDRYADTTLYQSSLIISQFCASQKDYTRINLSQLRNCLKSGTDAIFTWHVVTTVREEADEKDPKKTHTIRHHEYIVDYAGDSYYAENVFHLSEDDRILAANYAGNLQLYLQDFIETN